ncbi:MAG: hypothetical protein L0Z62_14255 [Gemmataceae bacterium]|nr:hypothetical protein [Gemmataceae bacterium]
MTIQCDFSEPTPLRPAAILTFQWGTQTHEVICTACSLRTAAWPDTGEELTWLYCRARPTREIEGESAGMMPVLIPAHYVTSIRPGPTFQLLRHGKAERVGVFPPIHSTPANRLALSEIEEALAPLLDSGRN